MNNTTQQLIKRQLLIIQLLLKGHYVSTQQIQNYLKEHGIETKLRTLQRDLISLEEILPIECRKDDKPYSWRWQRLSNTAEHQLSLSQAIALRLVETELKGIIPTDLYERLQPLFIKSHFVTGLSQLQGIGYSFNNDESQGLEAGVIDPTDLVNSNIGFHKHSFHNLPEPPWRKILRLLQRNKDNQSIVYPTDYDPHRSIARPDLFITQTDEVDEQLIAELKDFFIQKNLIALTDLLED